jgi:photosystem II stability/assembly factor-like uncharacterized protein
MRLFSSPTREPRGSSTGGKNHFSTLLLVAVLLVGAGAFFVLPVHATPNAQAATAPTTPIQLSQIDMINPLHGWALNSNRTRLYVTNQGSAHWTDVTPASINVATGDRITASFFLSATSGYLGVLENNQPVLLSTTNGGQSWQSTPFTITGANMPPVIQQITFLNAHYGWLSIVKDQVQPGQFDIILMSTSDGGQNWQTMVDTSQNPANLPTPYSMTAKFMFTSPLDGWITGEWPGTATYLYQTTDGGKIWTPANIAPIKGSANIYDTQTYSPYWQNSSNGTLYVRFDTGDGNSMPHLATYRTYDGGKSWILGPSSTSTSFEEFTALNFLNYQEGWSFGFDGQGQFTMHTTTTGGLSWRIIHPTGLIAPDADNQVIMNLSFLNASTGWVIIKDAQSNLHLFQTNNAGLNWHEVNPVTSAS